MHLWVVLNSRLIPSPTCKREYVCSYTFLESSQASGEETHTCSVCVRVSGNRVGARVGTSSGHSGRSRAEARSGAEKERGRRREGEGERWGERGPSSTRHYTSLQTHGEHLNQRVPALKQTQISKQPAAAKKAEVWKVCFGHLSGSHKWMEPLTPGSFESGTAEWPLYSFSTLQNGFKNGKLNFKVLT